MAGKSSLKDKLEDDELDLSMMQLAEIPVKDIELLGQKVVTINLSHNLLTSMPPNFPLLTHVTKLDLSKNGLLELPENFGGFKALKSLDLYANRLERLPVSFAQLKNLKWLDLKDNPLCPGLKQAAGDCITPNDCALCAKKVVALLQSMESQLQRERQRRMEEEMKTQREVDRKEEAERERVRTEKKLAKERRREEAKVREAELKKEPEVKPRLESQTNGNGTRQKHQNGGGAHGTGELGARSGEQGRGCLASILLFLMGLGVVGLGLAVSLLWVYTEGRLDSKSVASALPVIQADVSDYLVTAWGSLEEGAGPYVESSVKSGRAAWAEGGKQLRKAARWVEKEHGASLSSLWASLRGLGLSAWTLILQLGQAVTPYLAPVWEASKPFFHQLGKVIIEKCLEFGHFLQTNFPAYTSWLTETGSSLAQGAATTWHKVAQAF